MKTTRRSLATLLALFIVFSAFAEIPKLHNPGIHAKITPDQIKALQKAAPKNPTNTVVLTFEGLGNLDPISQFYNGGTSGDGYSGTNYGIYFSSNTLALIDYDAGGSGNFANEPSPSTGMFFLDGNNAIMNVTAGFATGFSFYYTAQFDGIVYVYDGLDGTGNLLATQPLPANFDINCTGDPTGDFCHWDPIGVSFAGTAKSISFTGVQNQCIFDNVTFGSITPPNQIILSQTTSSGPVGISHTVTATVQSPTGGPAIGTTVTFTVLTGPNAGTLGTAVTNSLGIAIMTYTGTVAGIDDINACINPGQAPICSNELTYEWIGTNIPTMSQWGLILLAVALLGVGTVYILRRKNSDVTI